MPKSRPPLCTHYRFRERTLSRPMMKSRSVRLYTNRKMWPCSEAPAEACVRYRATGDGACSGRWTCMREGNAYHTAVAMGQADHLSSQGSPRSPVLQVDEAMSHSGGLETMQTCVVQDLLQLPAHVEPDSLLQSCSTAHTERSVVSKSTEHHTHPIVDRSITPSLEAFSHHVAGKYCLGVLVMSGALSQR